MTTSNLFISLLKNHRLWLSKGLKKADLDQYRLKFRGFLLHNGIEWNGWDAVTGLYDSNHPEWQLPPLNVVEKRLKQAGYKRISDDTVKEGRWS